MAIELDVEYVNATPGDASYPGGSFKNVSAPAAGDGTPLEKKWANDWLGFFQKILDEAGIVPSGNPDTVITSQYFQSLEAIFGKVTPGVAGNVGTLDGTGQLIDSGVSIQDLQANLSPQGTWNADANTPDINATAVTGDYWIVSVAGTTPLDGITDWEINDWAVKTATGWAKIDNTTSLTSDELAGIQAASPALTGANPIATMANVPTAAELAGIQASPTPITGANPAASVADIEITPSGAWELLSTTSFTNTIAVDCPTDLTSAFRMYFVRILGAETDTNSEDLCLRFSDDGGSSFESGASDYYSSSTAGNESRIFLGGGAFFGITTEIFGGFFIEYHDFSNVSTLVNDATVFDRSSPDGFIMGKDNYGSRRTAKISDRFQLFPFGSGSPKFEAVGEFELWGLKV